MSTKSFFPWSVIHHEKDKSSFFHPRKSIIGPDSEIRGKPSQTALKYNQSLSQMFSSVLEKKDFYSQGPALYQHCKVKMTFKALDEISTRMAKTIAKIIKDSHATPNSDGDSVLAFIVHETDHDERVITLIFAVLKLGITYMALNPSSHTNDINWAMKVAKPVILVGGDGLSAEVKIALNNFHGGRISFEELWNSSRLDNMSLDSLNIALDMNDPEVWGDIPHFERTVGIFFTSGSVSSPHAVRIGAREILNRIHWQSKIFPTIHSDAFALSSPLTDPKSLVQIMTPLLNGKPLTLLSRSDLLHPELLADRVAEVKLTRLTLTAPCFEALMNSASKNVEMRDKLASITHWFISGGGLKVETGRKYFSQFSGVYKSGVFLVVLYGMVETLGEATFEIFFNEEDFDKKIAPGINKLSVGVPITNSTVAIVDKFDKTVPLGGRGEVCLSGGCLSSGGYVGQGSRPKDTKSDNQRNATAELRKRHILFRTGDIGRILADSSGAKRLYIEGRFDNEIIQTGGESVNLQHWNNEVMATHLVTDAAIIPYHRGKDSQVIVAAVILRPEKTCVQVLEKLQARKGVNKNTLPTIFAVDKIPLTDNGRVDKKQLRILFRHILLDCDEAEWQILNILPEDGPTTKFLCKAIALSTGFPLVLVIRRFSKTFSELGGTGVNTIMVVKMCRDNGYAIRMKDFISVNAISELVGVLKRSKMPPVLDADAAIAIPPLLNNNFDGKFSFEILSEEDIQKVAMFLKNDIPSHMLDNPTAVLSYWRGVVDSVYQLKMCIVAKLGMNIMGVAITGDAQLKLLTPKPPKDILYGIELLDSCLAVSKYEMWRKSSGHVARCHFLGVSSSPSISPIEKVVLVEELLVRSSRIARSERYGSFLITTANPIIQETGIHLLKFHPILEFPVARFKSKDGTRPFTYADDNHTAAVLIKNLKSLNDNHHDKRVTEVISILSKDEPSTISGSVSNMTKSETVNDSKSETTLNNDVTKTGSTIISMMM